MSGIAALDRQARAILTANDRGGFTVPTPGLYPYQWNWDSVFASWGFATFDVQRAWQELETLFAGQWPNGMVPHILFRRDDPDYFPGPAVWGTAGIGPVPSGGISQPPVAATFVRALWERDKPAGEARLRALLPRIEAWHKWFMDWRTAEAGAVIATHPWETGRDNSPDWDGALQRLDPADLERYVRRDTAHVDPAMRPTTADYDRYLWLVRRGRRLGWDEARLARDRPFAVADPGLTFILLRANRDLAHMARATGFDSAGIDRWTRRLEQGAQQLRHPRTGLFNAVDLRTGDHAGHVTSASFLTWYAGIDDRRTRAALADSLASCRYPVPGLAKASPHFDAMRYWRGPTWAIMNALVGIGLAGMGQAATAERLRTNTGALIARHGFAEYFHPDTGEAAGGGAFTWTAAVWLAWASPTAGVNGWARSS